MSDKDVEAGLLLTKAPDLPDKNEVAVLPQPPTKLFDLPDGRPLSVIRFPTREIPGAMVWGFNYDKDVPRPKRDSNVIICFEKVELRTVEEAAVIVDLLTLPHIMAIDARTKTNSICLTRKNLPQLTAEMLLQEGTFRSLQVTAASEVCSLEHIGAQPPLRSWTDRLCSVFILLCLLALMYVSDSPRRR